MYSVFRPLGHTAVAISTKWFEVGNFFARIIKYKQILSSVIGKVFSHVKIYSLDNLYSSCFFAFDYKDVDTVDKRKKICRILVENNNFQPIEKK